MARRRDPRTVRSFIIPLLLGVVDERVASETERTFDLPTGTARRPWVDVPLETEQELPAFAAALAREPLLGIKAGFSVPRGSFGLYEFLARASGTLGGCLERLVRYLPLVQGANRLFLETRDGESRLVHSFPGEPLCVGRHGNEFLAAAMVRVVSQVLHRRWTPTTVTFAHPPDKDAGPLERHFPGSRLEFGAGFNALAFPAADLKLSMLTADEALLGVLEGMAAGVMVEPGDVPDWLAQARDQLGRLLPEGHPTLENLARAMRMSPRTLQRRLATHGLSFDALLASVRERLATALLQNGDLKLADVGGRLGYSDAAAFTRAFTRWTGCPPSEFRRRKALGRG